MCFIFLFPLCRMCWGSILILFFIFCNILVAHFWVRYKSNSTRMIIASNHLPLSTLKLPAINFCSMSPVSTNRLDTFIDTLYPFLFLFLETYFANIIYLFIYFFWFCYPERKITRKQNYILTMTCVVCSNNWLDFFLLFRIIKRSWKF